MIAHYDAPAHVQVFPVPDGGRQLRVLREVDGRAFALNFRTLAWEDIGEASGLVPLTADQRLQVGA